MKALQILQFINISILKLIIGQGNQVCLSELNYFRCWKNNKKTYTQQNNDIEILKNNVGINQQCYSTNNNENNKFFCKSFDGSPLEQNQDTKSNAQYNQVTIGENHLCQLSLQNLNCIGSNLISDNIPTIFKNDTRIYYYKIKSNAKHICVLYYLTEESNLRHIICWGSIFNKSRSQPIFTFHSHELKSWELGKDTLCIIFHADNAPNSKCVGNCLNGMCDIPSIVTSNVIDLAVGQDHACSNLNVDQAITIQCWGGNEQGQTNVPGEFKYNIDEVAVGQYISCAILQNNKVKCWGIPYSLNNMEQFGQEINNFNIDTNDRNLIDDINTEKSSEQLIELDNSIISIAVGGRHSCAILRGRQSCWGSNEFGQTDFINDKQNSIRQLTAGFDQTCYYSTNSKIECMGFNYVGQTDIPEEIEDTYSSVYSISSGLNHTCALYRGLISSLKPYKRNGKSMKCWGGLNEYGENESLSIKDDEQYHQVAAGHEFTCVSAVSSTVLQRNLVCSGNNDKGQTNVESYQYEKIISLTLGGEHGCLIENIIHCWGSDSQGQVSAPASIQEMSEARGNVTAGDMHTCGFNSDYEVVCWGLVQFDQGGLRGTQVASKNDYLCLVDLHTQHGRCVGINNHNGQCDVPDWRQIDKMKIKESGN